MLPAPDGTMGTGDNMEARFFWVESGLGDFLKTTPLPREVLACWLSYRFTALLAERGR